MNRSRKTLCAVTLACAMLLGGATGFEAGAADRGNSGLPPGPGNPLGTRWMGISSPGVGIHGTDDPASIGYSVSHGCIRMQVPSAEWLFAHVTVGTTVFIGAE